MGRIILELPERFHFECEIPLRITDINYGGHLGNDSVLSIVHEARVQFLAHFGFSESDIDGAGIIMTDAVILFKSEGFYGDKLLIKMAVDNITSRGCDIFYKLTSKSTAKEVAVVKTGIFFFDYGSKKITATPEKFILKFSE